MTTVHEAAQVLAKCACYDPMFAKPDAGMAAAWAESFSKFNLALDDLLEAVTRHYSDSRERAMPASIGRIARDVRQDRAMRSGTIPSYGLPNPAIGGMPIPTEGQPVWAAYDEGRGGKAIDRYCVRCQADPGEACVNPVNGRTSKIPCLVRLTGKHQLAEGIDHA